MNAPGDQFVAAFGKAVSDYTYTEWLTDTDWAWEYLRRNQTYRNDYYRYRARLTKTIQHASGVTIYRAGGVQHGARKWGLSCFANPDKNALETDLFWIQDALTYAVSAHSFAGNADGRTPDLDLFRDKNCKAVLCVANGKEVLVRSNSSTIFMNLSGVNPLFQPVHLRFQLDGFASLSAGTKALLWMKTALHSASLTGQRPLTQTTKIQRKKYLIALDCYQKGASLQDTARVFQAFQLTRLPWSHIGDEALKKQVWRSRNNGIDLMNSKYRSLL